MGAARRRRSSALRSTRQRPGRHLAGLRPGLPDWIAPHKEQAIRLLADYVEMQPQRRGQVATDPWWESLRGDPDFQALLTEE